MSHETPAGGQVPDVFVHLLRRCCLVVVPAGVVCAVAGAVTGGAWTALSAGIGAVIVVAFFGARLLVMRRTATTNPQLVLMTALLVYTVKIVLLGLALIVLTQVSWVDSRALGLAVLVCASLWLAVEMLGTIRQRVPVFGSPTAVDGERGERS